MSINHYPQKIDFDQVQRPQCLAQLVKVKCISIEEINANSQNAIVMAKWTFVVRVKPEMLLSLQSHLAGPQGVIISSGNGWIMPDQGLSSSKKKQERTFKQQRKRNLHGKWSEIIKINLTIAQHARSQQLTKWTHFLLLLFVESFPLYLYCNICNSHTSESGAAALPYIYLFCLQCDIFQTRSPSCDVRKL